MKREIVNPEIHRYLEQAVPARDPIATQMEQIAAERGFPIVGPVVGQLLYQLARGLRARRVFEMGSGFGYSTWWFARAVGAEGQVIHTDGALENSARAQSLLERAGLAERVTFQIGDARELLAQQDGSFDVIFCDIDKHQYPDVPEIALPRLRRGGLLIFDNILWSGQVLDPSDDPNTAGVQQVTRRLLTNPELITTILPIRDGVSVSLRV